MDGKRKHFKPRLAAVSRDQPGGLSNIKKMKCFEEFDRRVRLGWTTPALIKMIQVEQGECSDISPVYLKKLVDEYRSKIPPVELSMASSGSLASRIATRKVVEGVNELDELEKLYAIQMRRINIDFENEQKINKLFNTTGKEVFVAMKILRQSAELKMDLGLVKRQLGTMEVTGQIAAEVGERYGKDSIGKVIADPESRRKVLGLAERLFQLGAKASLDVVDMLGAVHEESKEVIDAVVVEPPQLPEESIAHDDAPVVAPDDACEDIHDDAPESVPDEDPDDQLDLESDPGVELAGDIVS